MPGILAKDFNQEESLKEFSKNTFTLHVGMSTKEKKEYIQRNINTDKRAKENNIDVLKLNDKQQEEAQKRQILEAARLKEEKKEKENKKLVEQEKLNSQKQQEKIKFKKKKIMNKNKNSLWSTKIHALWSHKIKLVIGLLFIVLIYKFRLSYCSFSKDSYCDI